MGTNWGLAYGALDSQTQVVELHGELDRATVPALRALLDVVYDAGTRRIIVDLGEVTFVDLTELRALVAAHRKLIADGGALVVMCSDPLVRRVFDVTEFIQLLTVVESPRAAIEAASAYLTTG